ncbi:hypothetical protein F4780DRAFT_548113 [Xylariomycetidae sp. FL0641]|nr:hypothetical protein F4780DRAFT_548113 [Xylariomycetidae sp. FL0641]
MHVGSTIHTGKPIRGRIRMKRNSLFVPPCLRLDGTQVSKIVPCSSSEHPRNVSLHSDFRAYEEQCGTLANSGPWYSDLITLHCSGVMSGYNCHNDQTYVLLLLSFSSRAFRCTKAPWSTEARGRWDERGETPSCQMRHVLDPPPRFRPPSCMRAHLPDTRHRQTNRHPRSHSYACLPYLVPAASSGNNLHAYEVSGQSGNQGLGLQADRRVPPHGTTLSIRYLPAARHAGPRSSEQSTSGQRGLCLPNWESKYIEVG